MISYNNSDVVQCLRQYEMFANSLNLVKNTEQRGMIVKQLTKLEQKIISLTNEVYEEEYKELANKECGLLDEEKSRLSMLIDLINQRLSYIEKRCNNHYELTGETIDVPTVLGTLELDDYENRVRIINKYIKNVRLDAELNEEVKSLTSKISLASEKMDINSSLNVELEGTFKKCLEDAFQRLRLYDLLEIEKDIEYACGETEEALTLASVNLETAKTSPMNILADCQAMYDDISRDYVDYRDKLMTIRLMKVYDSEVYDYDSLLNKRKEINDILRYIKNSELLDLIGETVNKQYSTILMEGQDINTYNDLVLERSRKEDAIKEIEEENNSEEFQSVLKVLIENERKKQERILEEQRKIEEEEKRKKQEIERKKQEEILKRQRIIEEARKKEMEKRTKQMLEEQQKFQTKKKEEEVTFETMKDNSLEEAKEIAKVEEKAVNLDELNNKYKLDLDETNDVVNDKVSDIERELFAEFNDMNIPKRTTPKIEEEVPEPIFEPVQDVPFAEKEPEEDIVLDDIPQLDREVLNKKEVHDSEPEMPVSENKFPTGSLDDYMRNFDENKVSDNTDFFGSDAFPSIPM